MKALFCLFLLACCLPYARPDEIDQAKAKAGALLLCEKLARERGPVWRDLGAATSFAAESGRQLIIYVGKAAPEVIQQFPNAVHVQVVEYAGSNEPRVVVPTPAGYYWQIAPATASDQAEAIRKALSPRPVSFIRPRLSVSVAC